MLRLFLVMRRPLRPMDSPFLGMCWLLLSMRNRLLAMQRQFLAMLRPFAATLCEDEAAGHEESPGHHALCPLSDPFRGRGTECIGMHRLLVPMSRSFLGVLSLVLTTPRQSRGRAVPFLAMLHAFAATRCEGEDAVHEESPRHQAICPLSDLFRRRGSECVGSSSVRETTCFTHFVMPREPLETPRDEGRG
jgi:hypothetical protein